MARSAGSRSCRRYPAAIAWRAIPSTSRRSASCTSAPGTRARRRRSSAGPCGWPAALPSASISSASSPRRRSAPGCADTILLTPSSRGWVPVRPEASGDERPVGPGRVGEVDAGRRSGLVEARTEQQDALAVGRALRNSFDATRLAGQAQVRLGLSGVPGVAREPVELALGHRRRSTRRGAGETARAVDRLAVGAEAGVCIAALLLARRSAVRSAVADLGASGAVEPGLEAIASGLGHDEEDPVLARPDDVAEGELGGRTLRLEDHATARSIRIHDPKADPVGRP